jgi:hypothetical protein
LQRPAPRPTLPAAAPAAMRPAPSLPPPPPPRTGPEHVQGSRLRLLRRLRRLPLLETEEEEGEQEARLLRLRLRLLGGLHAANVLHPRDIQKKEAVVSKEVR